MPDRPASAGLSTSPDQPQPGALVAVLLPDGFWIRGKLPTVGTLIRAGLMPRDLVAVAAHFADAAWLTAAVDIPDEERDKRLALLDLLVRAYPRERWDGESWVPCPPLEDLREDTIDLLGALVQGRITAAEMTALSRSAEEVEDVGIDALTEFRGDGRGAGGGADGTPLDDAPEPDAGRGE